MPHADPVKAEAFRRAWREKNKEYIRAKRREDYLANAAKYRARSRAYYLANRPESLARAAECRAFVISPAIVLWRNARNRAKKRGIEFTILPENIVVPHTCPVLGIPLIIANGAAQPGSPSIDRIDPRKGYIPGNIAVISHKANTIKSNSNVAEIRAVLAYMEAHSG